MNEGGRGVDVGTGAVGDDDEIGAVERPQVKSRQILEEGCSGG